MANYNYSIVGKELSIKSRPEGNEQINSREPVFVYHPVFPSIIVRKEGFL